MAQQKYLPYRGDIKAAAGSGDSLHFVTVHPENQPTGFWHVDVDKVKLKKDDLPCGGVALAVEESDLWVCGTDGQIYHASTKSGKPKPLGEKLPAPARVLLALPKEKLAVLSANHLLILDRKQGKILQQLDLEETGTCLASDPSGQWLVAGTNRGKVSVFECEDKPQY